MPEQRTYVSSPTHKRTKERKEEKRRKEEYKKRTKEKKRREERNESESERRKLLRVLRFWYRDGVDLQPGSGCRRTVSAVSTFEGTKRREEEK